MADWAISNRERLRKNIKVFELQRTTTENQNSSYCVIHRVENYGEFRELIDSQSHRP